MALLAASGWAGPAAAQGRIEPLEPASGVDAAEAEDLEAGAPSLEPSSLGPATPVPILVVSMEAVRSRAKAALSIEAQAATIRKEIERELSARQRTLSAEEQALVALRGQLGQGGARVGAAEQFEARAARFERQARLLKQDRRRQAAALRDAVRAAVERLDFALRPILAQIMAERNAVIMIDKREVVISAKTLDVTGLAINRLDATLPSLEVRWPPSENAE